MTGLMRYVLAKLRLEMERKTYRYYVADCLKMIAHNTAAQLPRGGQYTEKRYSDLFAVQEPQDGNEIAARVIKAVAGG